MLGIDPIIFLEIAKVMTFSLVVSVIIDFYLRNRKVEGE
jgi:hypothetical protein